jgi:hypothetical protein
MKSYVKEFLARVAGDQDAVLAEKNYRQAASALKLQLSKLEAKRIDDEDAVETAFEKLNEAKYQTKLISDRTGYITGLKTAKDNLTKAQAELDATKEAIYFFSNIQGEFDVEVEAPVKGE